MPYSQFTSISKVKEAFGLKTQEGGRFIPAIEKIEVSTTLKTYLEESIPIASSASEKARSEGIIYPVFLEVRKILTRQVSLFSGEDFTVDESVGLNGICDFLLSRSSAVLEIEAPVIVIVEAKKADLRTGFGQCIAEMVAAQRFNAAKNRPGSVIYGSITSGTQWRFLKLENDLVTIDLTDYSLPPVEEILGMLVWMMENGG
ncbi:hypothetical protein A0J48_018200 [Sphaerospermopsis aphanizomenoides BCCUSP55]|uniref:hypothetical protein n=1 Tax=Sphaerospermopsis aphanizomenoides TaxID=459663 RepID=UPI0019066099|nr:hypothetical protein [Sphaerospermopsis aphanizomenoides]MBK1989443.1 hypothetical protein [Sphaerospermopsis aphanizomenoides BCCUSP55]